MVVARKLETPLEKNRKRFVRLAVLVSGGGTNLQALIDAIARGELNAQIVLVMSNKPGVLALSRAEKAGIPCEVLLPKKSSGREAYDEALAEKVSAYKVDLVVLAGFMRILSGAFLKHFPQRVINIHPALLPEDPEKDQVILPDGTASPAFRGLHVVEQALKAGVKWTGCTVHLATTDLDRGPVLKREVVPVLPGDTVETLHARIQEKEHKILPLAIARWAGRFAAKPC